MYIPKEELMKKFDESIDEVGKNSEKVLTLIWNAMNFVMAYYKDTFRLIKTYPKQWKELFGIWIDVLENGINITIKYIKNNPAFEQDLKNTFTEYQKRSEMLDKIAESLFTADKSNLEDVQDDDEKYKSESEKRYDELSHEAYLAQKDYQRLVKNFKDGKEIKEKVAEAYRKWKALEKSSSIAFDEAYKERKAFEKDLLKN